MILQKILENLEDYTELGNKPTRDIDISGISFDTRNLEKGDLFVAIKGIDADGHKYINKAIEKGASAVLFEDETHKLQDKNIPFIKARNSREALARIAAAFYGFPARKLKIIGVTGTDGKTTTSTLIHHILNETGHKAGLITSINVIIGDRVFQTGFHTTTPDALSIQKYLAEMVAAGTEYAVIETSSHGLAQYRVEACEYDIAVLTNITSEHLDFHKSREEYIHAKAHLFELLSLSYKKNNVPKISVLNYDDPSYSTLTKYDADQHFSFGLSNKADFWADKILHNETKLKFNVHTPIDEFEIASPLLGEYNVYNILAAVTVAYSQNIPKDRIISAIDSLQNIKGRMELIPHTHGDFNVIIDFAHTANALEQALRSVRVFTKNRIHVVFGSAGLRDIQKRKEMGIIAGKLADKIYITAEDPRTESVEAIIEEVATGCAQEGRKEGIDFFMVPDREEAIEKAIISAQDGDTVITCGKAHETTMCYGTHELPWSEYLVVLNALKKRELMLTENPAVKKE
ncbi:MAG: UDP-N-acetylmuramoyl-L-alanyl-D-glutamate--2,6-diaminopimelate ligase [Candidatus Celaenobacter antarcticus]|nr:UDP-N-acetylmuramoyl-L-alanyl-D-glutamate--2,6-diaminopimelate ligase [Candidatus Celaenobacter antarcticus]